MKFKIISFLLLLALLSSACAAQPASAVPPTEKPAWCNASFGVLLESERDHGLHKLVWALEHCALSVVPVPHTREVNVHPGQGLTFGEAAKVEYCGRPG